MSEHPKPLTPYLRLATVGAALYVGSKVLGTVQQWTGVAAFATLNFLLFVGAAVLGGIFMGRVGGNLDRLDRGDRTWSTALGVTLWYLPIVNLFLPFFVTREWLRASRAETDQHERDPDYLKLWWGLWALAGAIVVFAVLYGVAGGAQAILDAGANETAIEDATAQAEEDQYLAQGIFSTASTLLVIAALPFYLRVCRRFARLQDERIAERFN